MSLEEYHAWKQGADIDKFHTVKEFWKTNPSDEQIKLSKKISDIALFLGFILGISGGTIIGFILGYLLV